MLGASGCSTRHSLESAYLAIQEEVQRGQLDAALHDANKTYKKYPGMPSETAWKFRVQKAHILFLRGSYRDSLLLLDEDLPPSIKRSGIAARLELVRGLDHTYLQEFKEADQDLSVAAGIAESSKESRLSVDIAQARGILELYRRKYPEAAVAFRATLAMARQQNLPSPELNALGNLGNVAMWQEHYDEAIDWFKQTLQKSRTLHEADTEAKTLGNLGWSYSVVGDFENAETFLTEAQMKSGQAGLRNDQVYWLTSLASTYSEQNRYSEADSTARGVLALAEKQDNKETLTHCYNTLSEIALATGRVDEAEKYNKEALGIEQAGLDQFGVTSSTIIAGRIAASKKQYGEAEKAFQKVIRGPGVETPMRWEAQASLAQVHAAMGNTVLAKREFGESISTISKAWDELQREDFRLSFLSSAIRFYDAYVNFLVGRSARSTP